MTENTDYQLGVHDIDKTPSLGGEEDFIEFEFESAAIFKRLADDIYESDEAGIREPLSNAITAVRRAEEEHGLDNGVIEITLEEEPDGATLTIKDNGIGISRSVLEKVLSVIGRSQNRDDGALSGKYGMGFLACYKLVGTDGGFIMHTNSRKTDNEPVSGIWKPGGFDRDKEGNLVGGLEDDEYGTVLKFPLQEYISSQDIQKWVKRHAKWSRVPIVYRVFNQDGKETFNEDYGTNTLEGQYDDGKKIVIDSEYFKAVAAENSNKQTLLLDSPIKRNTRGRHGSPWRFDVRLKNENGVIVEGPNEGLMPVSDEEYKSMDDERQERFIPESRVRDDDIRLPSPIGTRDKLERQKEFWRWLGDRLMEHYHEMIAERLEDIGSFDDYLEADESKIGFLKDGFNKMNLWTSDYDDFQKKAKKKTGVDVPEEVAKVFNNMRTRVYEVPRGTSRMKKAESGRSGYVNRTDVASLIKRIGNEGEVYMGVTLNQEKCEVVWEDNENNAVITVDNSNSYGKYAELFGWKKLKNVRKNLDEFDISEETREKFESKSKSSKNAGKDSPARNITVHTSDSSTENVGKIKARMLRGEREDNSASGPYNKLVLFPSNTDENLTDYRWMASSRAGIATANCTVGVWEYLSDCENVTRIEHYLESHERVEFQTSDGVMTAPKATEHGTLVFHIMNEETLATFREEEIMANLQDALVDRLSGLDDESNVVYTPVTGDMLDEIRPWLRTDDEHIIVQGSWSYSFSGANKASIKSDMYLYAKAQLPEWEDTQELLMFRTNFNSLNERNINLVETMKLLHDAGEEPQSLEDEQLFDPLNIEFETSEGEITLREAVEIGKPVFHLLGPEKFGRFSQSEEIMTRLKEYIAENAHKRFDSDKTVSESYDEEIVYIPTTSSKYKEVSDHLDEPVYIGGSTHTDGDEYRIGRTHMAYAHARLPEWVGTDEFKQLDKRLDSSTAFNFIETLSGLHDKGMSPASIRDK